MRAPDQAALSLWIVNQYAQRFGQPGIARHSTLAHLMVPHGVQTTIFSGETHYWTPGQKFISTGTDAGEGSTCHVIVPAPTSGSNGAWRVVSMTIFSLRTVVAGWRRSARGAPDVVVGSSPHPFGAVAAWVLARRHRAAFVLEVRDIWPKSLVMLLGTASWHPFVVVLSFIERFLYRRADLIITLLPGSEEHIHSVCSRTREIHYIPNGVDVAQATSPGPPPDREDFLVMYAGAHGVPNSLDTLIRAAATIAEREQESGERYPCRVELVGDGKEKNNLTRLARELGTSNVKFLEPVPKNEVMELLGKADVLVLTLVDSPVFRDGISPNKLFDYMAAERPVIMSVETPLDPVREAGAGLTVPPGDPVALAEALLDLRSRPISERIAMGRRGRAYVERNHDLRFLAERYAQALRTAAGSAR